MVREVDRCATGQKHNGFQHDDRFQVRHTNALRWIRVLCCRRLVLRQTCRKFRKSSRPMSQILRKFGVCSTKLRSRYKKMFRSVKTDEQWSCHFLSTSCRKALLSGVCPRRDSISLRMCEAHSAFNLIAPWQTIQREYWSCHVLMVWKNVF